MNIIWSRRIVFYVFFIFSAAWRLNRPDCMVLFMKPYIDAGFGPRWYSFMLIAFVLICLDILLQIRNLKKYQYTYLSQFADVVTLSVIGYQIFFSPGPEFYH